VNRPMTAPTDMDEAATEVDASGQHTARVTDRRATTSGQGCRRTTQNRKRCIASLRGPDTTGAI
jgi:hypothetical protein